MKHFYALERHSMLELEPPAHTRLRGLVLRAFTSRRIMELAPEIEDICADLLQTFPNEPFDLLKAYCSLLPVRIIARLLGVPESKAPDLLRWSNAMVAVYMAGRTRAVEEAADAAAAAFAAYLSDHIETRRNDPQDDLITQLIAAEEQGERLSTQEMISTCVLLLNAGHEATVHSLGNGVKALIEAETPPQALDQTHIGNTVEEILRYDPPLHIFTRYAYEEIDLGDDRLQPGEEVALVIGAAGRDPLKGGSLDRFDPFRRPVPHSSFGGGLHFCVGAPLARLEMQIGLQQLFRHAPDLRFADVPRYGNTYHFRGLDRLRVQPAS